MPKKIPPLNDITHWMPLPKPPKDELDPETNESLERGLQDAKEGRITKGPSYAEFADDA